MKRNNYEETKAIANELNKKPPKDNLFNQKFHRGARVKVCDEMPPDMSHFPSGFEAIVNYTYGQKFWGDDANSYCLIVLNDKREPINEIAWYCENQLTLVDDDIKTGLEIIKKWNKKRNRV